MAIKLDRIDLRILTELQTNGRISIVDLAERVGLSKTPCGERVRKLEARGVIEGYRAQINPELVGAAHYAIVQIVLSATTARNFDAFAAAVQCIPEIQSCHMIAGDFDYLLMVRTQDIQNYRQLLGEVISRLPAIQQSHSYVVMESVKDSYLLPLQAPNDTFDAPDDQA